MERASDIFLILFSKKKFGMANDFGASENIYLKIFKISDFGTGFEGSNVFFGEPTWKKLTWTSEN